VSLRVVLCNAPPDRAEGIARALVDQRVAACVNLVPGVISIYRWKGNVEREPETTMLIKTRDDRVAALMEALKKLHPYEVPEIVVLPVADVNAAYAQWIEDETR